MNVGMRGFGVGLGDSHTEEESEMLGKGESPFPVNPDSS